MTNQAAQTMPELPDGAKTPYKPPYASVLGTRCAELARAISYHDPEPIGAIKHTLREAAYFIDSQCVKTGENGDVRGYDAGKRSTDASGTSWPTPSD